MSAAFDNLDDILINQVSSVFGILAQPFLVPEQPLLNTPQHLDNLLLASTPSDYLVQWHCLKLPQISHCVSTPEETQLDTVFTRSIR